MDDLDKKIQEMRNQRTGQKESDFVRIFEHFLSDDGIRGKTKITPAQRNMIYVYDLMHKKHPNWGLKDAATNLAHLFISQDGESRKQGIELFRGLLSQMRDESLSIETGTKTNPPTPQK